MGTSFINGQFISESFQDTLTFVSLCKLKTEGTQVANTWIMCFLPIKIKYVKRV